MALFEPITSSIEGLLHEVVHPEEQLAVFPFALPTPLNLGPDARFGAYLRMNPAIHQALKERSGELLLRPTRDTPWGEPATGRLWKKFGVPQQQPMNQYLLLASIAVTNVELNLATSKSASELADSILELGGLVSAQANPSRDAAMVVATELRGMFQELAPSEVTVATCTVPLRVVGGPLPLGFYADLDLDVASMADSFVDHEPADSESALSRIAGAMVIAVQLVGALQRAYLATTGTAGRPLTLQDLPMFTPFMVCPRFSSAPTAESGMCVASPKRSAALLPSHPLPTPGLVGSLSTRWLNDRSPFGPARYALQEARQAALLEGNSRSSVIFAAMAAESLFDTVLLLMLWEEGRTPEAVAQEWRLSISDRVKTQFSGRLAGNWDVSGNPQLADWNQLLARRRNAILHAVTAVHLDAGHEALAACEGIRKLLADRVSTPNSVARYPLTAWSLLGLDEMIDKGILTRRVKTRLAGLPPEELESRFERWRGTMLRELARKLNGTEFTTGSWTLVRVYLADAAAHYALVDQDRGMAATLSASQAAALAEGLTPEMQEQLDGLAVARPVGGSTTPFSVALESEGCDWQDFAISRTWSLAWQNVYAVLPGYGCLADETDLSIGWPDS